jgi:hypothetical protein
MKTKIALKDFFKYAGIKYEDDLYSNVYCPYEKFTKDEILKRLPKEYKNITSELLEVDSDLTKALEQSLNETNEVSLLNEEQKAQDKAVEKYASDMVDYINSISETKEKAIKSIFIDWCNEEAVIDFNVKPALTTIRYIINGEGMFYYENDKSLACVHDGKNKPTEAVINHLHYLLNINLIDEIFGMCSMPRFNWDADNWSFDEECFKESLRNNVHERYTKLKTATNIAIAIDLAISKTLIVIEEMKNDLYDALQNVPANEVKEYQDYATGVKE